MVLENNNVVSIKGEIEKEFVRSHECCGAIFYKTYISVLRNSGISDIIPVFVEDTMLDFGKKYKGLHVNVNGQFRSHNNHSAGKSKLELSVFAIEFFVENEKNNLNCIHMDGYICKEPVYRTTPAGREIADILLAVNRAYGKSDYIPCICWGRNARFAGKLAVGEHVAIWGRIQSREYIKRFENGTKETKIAYETSISKIIIKESE